MKPNIFFKILLTVLIISCTTPRSVKETTGLTERFTAEAPAAEKITTTKTYHGVTLTDEYAWMKDLSREDPKVMSHIKKENEYFKKYTDRFSGLKEQIYNEIISRIDQTDMSVPVKIDQFYYYSREVKGKQYPVYCRKLGDMQASEEVLLDLNELSQGHDYFDLDVYKISPDHRFLAYSVDTAGNERYTLYVKYLKQGTLFPEQFKNVDDVVWAEDNNTFFYTTINNNERTDTVMRHVVGTGVESDRKMYAEDDESFYVWVDKTKDRKYVLIGTASKNTSEIYYLESTFPMGYFDLIAPREEGVEYYIEHQKDNFLILTNADRSPNFKIMRVKDNFPYRDRWKEYFPHREDVYLEDFEMFKNYMVLTEIADGKKILRIVDYTSLSSSEIKFNDDCYTVDVGSNPEYNSEKLRYVFESMVTPYSIVEYNMRTGKKEFLKQQNVVGGYDRMEYNSELVYANASDYKRIPISLVYRRDKFKGDGSNPLLLEAYGAYGSYSDADFSISRISLLDRGFVYAVAHVRGGIEKGKEWHDGGMLLNKKNTFSDFISCAEYLIEKKYTSEDRLMITGSSAGGMLIGAVLNERPFLFNTAVLEVPFVDVLNTMLDPELAATVTEYDEWGDPQNKKYFEYIRSYCPYQNIGKKAYPEIMVKAGMNDPRVNYWEPLKWTAKIRDNNIGDTNTVLSITDTGHGGSSGRFDYYKDIAETYAYLVSRSKMTR